MEKGYILKFVLDPLITNNNEDSKYLLGRGIDVLEGRRRLIAILKNGAMQAVDRKIEKGKGNK